jgi:hypothetical protein
MKDVTYLKLRQGPESGESHNRLHRLVKRYACAAWVRSVILILPPTMVHLTQRKGKRKAANPPTPTPAELSLAVQKRAQEAAAKVLADFNEHERRIQETIDLLRALPSNEHSIPKAIACLGYTELCRQTVWRRFTNHTTSAHLAQEAHMLLSLAIELVLVAWIKHQGRQGKPATRVKIRYWAKELGGLENVPGEKWLMLFLKRHPDVKLRTPRLLDPKRAQCFNPTTVKKHFSDVQVAMDGVEERNIYNLDECGIQRGGGRKCLGRQVAFASDDAFCYQRRSENLELTTVIDVVCADGTAPVPGFVFAGKNVFEEKWFDNKDVL